MKRILTLLLITVLFIGCKKEFARKEKAKIAGTWKIETVEVQYYDISSKDSIYKSSKDLGYLHFYLNDDEKIDNSFSLSYTNNYSTWGINSCIIPIIDGATSWWATPGGKSLGFSYYYQYNTQTKGVITIVKATTKKLTLRHFYNRPTGQLYFYETWNLSKEKVK
ncbi:MAG: hypothetical protein H3C31_11690 [Brumimicrobium sp.]|nr:hypothetical protein [Brumimicrobium sp.]MCO5268676.1 hypothetical protein [Brumimicrobium sp.]